MKANSMRFNQQFHTIALALIAGSAFATTPVGAQTRDEALLAASTAEQTAVLRTLERLVNIETGTGNEEGSRCKTGVQVGVQFD